MSSREQAYKAINSERDYQNRMMSQSQCWQEFGRNPSIGEELLMIEEYVLKARQAWVSDWGNKDAGLDEIRKIAGLCVRVMENHGAPLRS